MATTDERNSMTSGPTFAPWIKRYAGGADSTGSKTVVVFPHAGGAAAAYRSLATALSGMGVDVLVVQYPQRADRLAHPAPASVGELAQQLFDAGDWAKLGPLRLFGHCMGAVVAFEFARVAERNGVVVSQLWASAGEAPSAVGGPLPSTDDGIVADMVDLGGTDARLLDDEEFVELMVMAVRSDYQALSGYSCDPGVRINSEIHAIGGEHDHRISADMLQRWEIHTDSVFTLSLLDGGHFYIDDNLDTVAELVTIND